MITLFVRDAGGCTFNGTGYNRGDVLTTGTDTLRLRAVREVGDKCDIYRTVSPGGQCPTFVAEKALMAALVT